jgi:hypothetical protein
MDSEQLFKIFSKIVIATMIIPIVVALPFIKKFNRPLRVFLYYLIGAFFVGLFSQIFIWATGAFIGFFKPILEEWAIKDTNFISIGAYLVNFSLLGWYFSSVFSSLQIQKSIKIISLFLILFAIVDNFFIHDWRAYNSDVATLSAVFCMVLPLFHLGFVYRTMTEIPIAKNPYFWIDLGLLVPNVLGLFLHFVGAKLFDTDKSLYYQVSMAKYYFVILSQFFFAYSFYLARYTKYLPKRW